MSKLDKKIESPKIDTIFSGKEKKNSFLKKLRKKQGTINWAIVVLFFIGLSITALVSVGPFFSAKYILPASSFDRTIEQKIIEDYYKLPDIKDIDLPFREIGPQDIKISGIEQKLEEELTSLQGIYGVYAKNLRTGEEFGLNQDNIFTAASLSKLFVVGAYYYMLENNPQLRDQIIVLKERDKVEGSGFLINETIGSEYYPNDLVEKMLQQSDNTAFAMMIRFLKFKNILGFIKKFGFYDTDFKRNTTTPKDVGSFLEKLYSEEFLSEFYKNQMIKYMTNTAFEDRLPYYLPEKVDVAHKIGTWEGAYSDAGIVYREKGDYIIVVMTEDANYTEAVNAIRRVSKVVYEYFS